MSRELGTAEMEKLNQCNSNLSRARKALELGYLEFAERWFAEALKAREAVFGGDDPLVGELKDELGAVKMKLGNYSDAHELFGQSLENLQKAYYDGHYKLGPVYSNQATCFIMEGNFEAAEEPAKKCQEIYSKTLSGDHRKTLEATYKLATVYKQIGKNADALKLFTRAKKSLESPLGPLDEFKFLEALIQEAEGKAEEADKAFQCAIESFKHRRNFARLSQCMSRYAQFLKSQGRHQEAQDLEARAEQYKSASSEQSRNQDIFVCTLVKA